MKKLLLCAGLLNFFNVYAMEEDEAFEGMISFYEAYLSSRLIYFNNGTVSCVHYVKGSQQPYVLSSKNVASHLENAKEQICKMYEDGRLRQIENLLRKGQPLNLYGKLALVLQSVHQFHVNADLDDSHTSIKKNREMYRNAWNTQDALDIALASRLPLYPQGEGHIPLTRKIEQLKEELGKQ